MFAEIVSWDRTQARRSETLFQNMSDFSPQYGSSEVLNSDGKTGVRGNWSLETSLTQPSILWMDGRANLWPFHLVTSDQRQRGGGGAGEEEKRDKEK